MEIEKVTDDKGKDVTDEAGKAVTKEVQVIYKKDNKGKYIAQVIDEKTGEPVTDEKTKNPVTIKSNVAEDKNNNTTTAASTKSKQKDTTNKKDDNSSSATEKTTKDNPKHTTTQPNSPTATTDSSVDITKEPETTEYKGEDNVPKTSDKGKEVSFSEEDQEIIASMLEVPYLYLSSYENSDGVPIDISTHVAVWMAERDGSTNSIYPSSPVVLNLFKYFGQTVVNFKTLCNDAAQKADAPITYVKSNDTFGISEFTPKKQTVKITKIEDLGNNNFYKVTADVDGCDKRKVIAIIQKNNLDLSLGFSIKALKWS